MLKQRLQHISGGLIMDKQYEISQINKKYERLISNAWNDTKNISIDVFFEKIFPKLMNQKQKEIEILLSIEK